MGKDISFVSAFYDIGRGDWTTNDIHCQKRTNDVYFGYFDILAELKNPLAVLVASDEHAERVFNSRKKHGLHGSDMTKIIVKPLPQDQMNRVTQIVNHGMFRNFVVNKDIPEFKIPGYSLVTNQKSQFVMDAINSGFVQTSQTAWIDFGYCRTPKCFNTELPWEYAFGNKINMWILRNLDDRPIFEVVRTALVYMMGNFIVGPTPNWKQFNDSWHASFNALLECGFTDDDQTTMLMVWRKNPELITLRPGRDAGPNTWGYAIREFNDNHNKTFVQQTEPQALKFDVSVLKF